MISQVENRRSRLASPPAEAAGGEVGAAAGAGLGDRREVAGADRAAELGQRRVGADAEVGRQRRVGVSGHLLGPHVPRFRQCSTIRSIWNRNRHPDGFSGRFPRAGGAVPRQPGKKPPVLFGVRDCVTARTALRQVLLAQGGFGRSRELGRFRNHDRAIPQPRGSDSGTAKLSWTAAGGLPRLGCHRNHDRKRDHRFMGQSINRRGGRCPRGPPAGIGGLLHLRPALGGPEGRHGVDGASAVHAGDPAGPADPALCARGGDDRGDAVGEGAGDDPRQGRADLLRQPADGGAERRAGGVADAAPEGARPARSRPTARPAATATGGCARPSSGCRGRGSSPTSRPAGSRRPAASG